MENDLNKMLNFHEIMDLLGKVGSIEDHDLFLTNDGRKHWDDLRVDGQSLVDATMEQLQKCSDTDLVIWLFDLENGRLLSKLGFKMDGYVNSCELSASGDPWDYETYCNWVTSDFILKDKVIGDFGSNLFDFSSGFHVWYNFINCARHNEACLASGRRALEYKDQVNLVNALCFMYRGHKGIICPYEMVDGEVSVRTQGMFSVVPQPNPTETL